MTLPRAIGLAGRLKSGKSTVATILCELYGYERIKFAGPLKAMVAALGLTEDAIEGSAKELPSDLLCGRTPRYAMQTLGTEWGRDTIGSDLWVNAWKARAKVVPLVVSDDCRFPNEAQAIRDLGGQIWFLDRHVTESDGLAHRSEEFAFNSDITIHNSGSIEELGEIVRDMIAELTFKSLA